jgi:hypothetical protein
MFSILYPVFFFLLKVILFIVFVYFLLIVLLILLVKTKQKDRFEKILLKPKKLPLWVDFFRWIIIDMLRGKEYSVWGIYMFVAKPGNGKTISMTEHIARVRKLHPDIHVYTNFNLKGQDGVIRNWQDIVEASDNSIIAIDEIHMLTGDMGVGSFPTELLGEITQNRHSRKQFITSTQDYDFVNINFKRVCNYIVLCTNFWGLDRLFTNHYFDRGVYESKSFLANLQRCTFRRYFVASDETYARYNTLEKITSMIVDLKNVDMSGTIQKLTDLSSSKELEPREMKYISNIIIRINANLANKELYASKEKEIEELKLIVEKLQSAS